MSKMTSSIHSVESLPRRRLQAAASASAGGTHQQQPKQQQPPVTTSQKSQSCNGATKTLTDFSIDSIIGRTRLAGCNQIAREATDRDQPIGQKYERTLDSSESACNAHQDTSPTDCGSNSLLLTDDLSLSPKHADSLLLLQSNMVKRERPKHFQCSWCPFKFSNNGQLRNHERIHTGERPFRCERSDCGRTFTRNEELTRHKLIHSGMRPHICRHCEKRFGRKDHLKKHERTHERKKSSRRSRASRAPLHFNHQAAHQELDMFLPIKLEYSSTHQSLPMPPCYNIANSTVPATSQPDVFYGIQNSLSLAAAARNDLLTSQIVSIARAATTSTLTPSVPMMGTPMQATQAIMTSANSAMQQLANNYLNSWFSVLGQQGQQ